MVVIIFGVTGHSNITDATSELVREEIVALLRAKDDDFTGMTCLARGADQAFADAVLEVGGLLSVVVPAHDYFDHISDAGALIRCRAFLAAAASKVTMDRETSGPEAYLDASRYLISQCDHLVAVWDGSPPTGGGGTADAVEYARKLGRGFTVIWPQGAERC